MNKSALAQMLVSVGKFTNSDVVVLKEALQAREEVLLEQTPTLPTFESLTIKLTSVKGGQWRIWVPGLWIITTQSLDHLSEARDDLLKHMRQQQESGIIVFPVDAVVRDHKPSNGELAKQMISINRSRNPSIIDGALSVVEDYWRSREATRENINHVLPAK